MAQIVLRLISIFFIADCAVILAHLFFSQRSWLFDLDQENNIPTIFAVIQVFLIAIIMIEIFLTERKCFPEIVPGKWIWLILSAAFSYLAIDDLLAIHEYVLRQTARDLLPPDSLWISLMPWQIVFGPVLAVTAALLITIMLTRFAKDKRLLRVAATALTCWILAVLLEGLAKPVFMARDWYSAGTVMEESLELLGGTFFLFAFAQYAVAIRTNFRPDSFANRSSYLFAKAGGSILLICLLGAGLVAIFSLQNSAWLYRHNAGVLLKRGQYDRAVIAFQRALQENPDDQNTLQALATAYMKAGNNRAALETCNKLLSIEQNRAPFWQLQAVILENLGRHPEAEKSIMRARELKPRSPGIWAQLGKCQQLQNKFPEALESYEMSLKLNPQQPALLQTARKLQTQLTGSSVESAGNENKNPVAHIDNPFEDGWDTEAFAKLADKQMKALGKLLKNESLLSIDSLSPLITTDFSCTPLLPENKTDIFSGQALTVQRGRSSGEQKSFSGAQGLLEAAKNLLSPFQPAEDIRSKFKIFRVVKDAQGKFFETKLYVNLTGHSGKEMVEQNATWSIRWLPTGEHQLPLLHSITVDQFEMARTNGSDGTLFSECTTAVLEANACYEPQLLRGFNHWLQTSQRRRHLFRLGTPGISVSDVNGDGLEDLYLCQEVGLPNRLFLHQEDNRLVDVSEAWGVDWLHDSRCALFFDWDNDGDQDLAVSVLGGVMLAENQGNEKFKLRDILSTSDDTQSMAAADYDQDGNIDLYVCVYRRDGKMSGEMTSLLPGEAENFVYHDANTGGPSALFRNDGNGGFTDVTDEVGLGDNNYRFSYAASWDDFDNDGDVDLYVANDFGRDNLYQNTNGTFKDIADEANIENSASGMAVISGDYDHDGWMDVFVSNMWSSAGNRVTTQDKFKQDSSDEVKTRLQRLARGNTLLKNKGDGGFEHKSADANVEVGRWAWGCQFIDFNNDSWEDLMVANGFITTDDSGDL